MTTTWARALGAFLVATWLLVPSPVLAGEWEELQPATSPAARHGHTMVTVEDEIYLFGGRSASGVALGDLWTWDRDQETWVELHPSGPGPVPRHHHGAAALGSRMFVGFGDSATGAMGDLWAYVPDGNFWQPYTMVDHPDYPTGSIAPHAFGGFSALDDQRIFVAGGYLEGGLDDHINAWIIYVDSPGKAGTAYPRHIMSLSPAVYGFVAATTGGQPTMVGGWLQGKAGPSGRVMVWNPEPTPWGTWETITPGGDTPLPFALAAAASWPDEGKAEWGQHVLILGGESADKGPAQTTVQHYNTRTSTWAIEDAMPIALSEQAAAALPPLPGQGDRLEVLMFGGCTGDGCNVPSNILGSTFVYTTDIPLEPTVATIYVPAAAHAPGLGNTRWLTDLEVHNRGTADAQCTVSLLVRDQANPDPETATFTVPAGQSVRYADVLDELFAFEGAAAPKIDADSSDLLITSRTFNQPEAKQGSGTFGQFIRGQAEAEAVGFGDEAWLIQLGHSADEESGFRTNIGFVNITDSPIDLEVALHDSSGVELGTVEEELEGWEYKQSTAIFGRVTSSDLADGYAVVTTTTQGGEFFCYASVIDNLTGDPIYVEPVAAMPAVGGVIAASAHAGGSAGSDWRTNLELASSGDSLASCTVALLEHDQPNPEPLTEALTVEAGQSVRWEDVLDSLFGFEGTAALRFEDVVGELRVNSRTFNQGDEGTFGQYIPIAAMGDAIGFGSDARLIQLTSSADPEIGFRTNIGFVNASEQEISVEADLYLANGQPLGGIGRTLLQGGYLQVNRVFEVIHSGEVADGFAVVRTTTEGGAFFCYASVVDNVTGDPIYIPAL